MKKEFENDLEKYCKNWFAKTGKLEDVDIHNLAEGICQAYNEDKYLEEYLRNSFKIEYDSKIKDICLGVVKPIVPCGKLISIYQSTNPDYPRLFAIIDEGRLGFGIGYGYDPIKGYWDQGRYNYKTLDDAINALRDKNEVKEIYKEEK